MQYGILIGRFQPLHYGHQAIINEILQDGLMPIILIGSSNNVCGGKNPLSYTQRASLINLIYGSSVITLPLPDNHSDANWKDGILYLLESMAITRNDCSLYFFHKAGDADLQITLADSFEVRKPLYPEYKISATAIRADLEGNKKYLDARVYHKCKELIYG